MRTALVIASIVTSGLVAQSPSASAGAGHDVTTPTVTAVRHTWPIGREPSGSWGVAGEVIARNAGRATAIRAVTFDIEGPFGRTLATRTIGTPGGLADIVGVFAPDASGALVRQPAGTLTLPPGAAAVIYVADLTTRPGLPRRATVTIRFERGAPRRVDVPLEVYSPGQRFLFPLRLDSEPWIAANTAGTPHHWHGSTLIGSRDVFISQRYAIDLVQIDGALRTHPEGNATKDAHYAWGEEVVSMGYGRVVAVTGDQRDLEIGEAPLPDGHPAGNHVVVQYGPKLFAVYAHLQQGSPQVAAGAWVAPGQVLGVVGNSGNTTEPHLHVHFVDRWAGSHDPMADFYVSQGLPALFWGARVVRGTQILPLHGSTPLELDAIVAADAASRP